MEMLERLYARRRFGMQPGLERIQALLARLGHPERELAAIHVAGTNGKGSVVAMVAEVLLAAGYPVGRYTSPHLVRFNERIVLRGRPVDDALLAAVLAQVEAEAQAVAATGAGEPTFFECVTAAAFEIFRRQDVRLVVIEVGLGGRYDATNVLTPLLSVITRIGLDHCQYLGDTLEAIAGEKAGIIKPGRPVVVGAMPEQARHVIVAAAAQAGAPLIDAAQSVTVDVAASTLEGLTVRLATGARDLGKVRLNLAGAYQLENVATAVAALDALAGAAGLEIPDVAMVTGLGRVRWPGRFQLVQREPPILVDGAHNPDGAAALRQALRKTRFKGPVALIAGFCDDKDAAGFLRTLASSVRCAWAVPVPSDRSLPAEATAGRMRLAGIETTVAATLEEALVQGQTWARREQGLLVICGSLFLAGAALRHFDALPWPDDARPADPNESMKARA